VAPVKAFAVPKLSNKPEPVKNERVSPAKIQVSAVQSKVIPIKTKPQEQNFLRQGYKLSEVPSTSRTIEKKYSMQGVESSRTL